MIQTEQEKHKILIIIASNCIPNCIFELYIPLSKKNIIEGDPVSERCLNYQNPVLNPSILISFLGRATSTPSCSHPILDSQCKNLKTPISTLGVAYVVKRAIKDWISLSITTKLQQQPPSISHYCSNSTLTLPYNNTAAANSSYANAGCMTPPFWFIFSLHHMNKEVQNSILLNLEEIFIA